MTPYNITINKRIKFDNRIKKKILYNIKNPNIFEKEEIEKYFKEEYDLHKDHNEYMVVYINDEKHQFDYEFFENKKELLKKYKRMYLFGKEEKSTFKYWLAHWCAYNMTALNMGIWKFKYLFHDIEKPFMRLFMEYDKVKKWHRSHNKHHLEYGVKHGFDKIDWEALMIDWECSQYSKITALRDFHETVLYEINGKWKEYKDEIFKYTKPLIDKYLI